MPVLSRWTASALLAVPVLVACWWRASKMKRSSENRHAEAGPIETARRHSEDKRALKAAKKEASMGRARAAAEKQLATLQSQLIAALSSPDRSQELVLASIDVEAWEGNTSVVTEIGLAFFTASGRGTFRHRHILVEEHLSRRNGKWVADNRDRFLFGNSEVMPLAQAGTVSSELHKVAYIIGHAIAGDLEWLRSIGVALDTAESKADQNIVDTQTLAVACETRAMRQAPGQAGSHGDRGCVLPAVQQRSLLALATQYDLEPAALHNGANDAAFTLQIMLAQCGLPFVPPPRTPSTHMSCPAFQALQATASAVASVMDDLLLQLEAELRPHAQQALVDQVTRFAQALAEGADISRYTHAGAAVAEVRFPAGLSAAERRLVHQTAQDKGLSSSSQGKGAGRFITVRAAGGFPMHGAGPRDDARRGRKAGGGRAGAGS